MRKFTAWIFLSVFLNYADAGSCPSNLPTTSYTSKYENKCLVVVPSEKTWDDARKYCQQLGGDLVTITSMTKQNFVMSQIRRHRHEKTWIGATDKIQEGKWLWVNGEMANGHYGNWKHGQGPTHHGFLFSSATFEDCALLDYSDNGRWNDYVCDSIFYKYQFICEFDQITTSTTTTTPMPTTTSTTTPTTTTTYMPTTTTTSKPTTTTMPKPTTTTPQPTTTTIPKPTTTTPQPTTTTIPKPTTTTPKPTTITTVATTTQYSKPTITHKPTTTLTPKPTTTGEPTTTTTQMPITTISTKLTTPKPTTKRAVTAMSKKPMPTTTKMPKPTTPLPTDRAPMHTTTPKPLTKSLVSSKTTLVAITSTSPMFTTASNLIGKKLKRRRQKSDGKGMKGWVIGVIVGSVALLGILALVMFVFIRKRRSVPRTTTSIENPLYADDHSTPTFNTHATKDNSINDFSSES